MRPVSNVSNEYENNIYNEEYSITRCILRLGEADWYANVAVNGCRESMLTALLCPETCVCFVKRYSGL